MLVHQKLSLGPQLCLEYISKDALFLRISWNASCYFIKFSLFCSFLYSVIILVVILICHQLTIIHYVLMLTANLKSLTIVPYQYQLNIIQCILLMSYLIIELVLVIPVHQVIQVSQYITGTTYYYSCYYRYWFIKKCESH